MGESLIDFSTNSENNSKYSKFKSHLMPLNLMRKTTLVLTFSVGYFGRKSVVSFLSLHGDKVKNHYFKFTET